MRFAVGVVVVVVVVVMAGGVMATAAADGAPARALIFAGSGGVVVDVNAAVRGQPATRMR